MAQKKRSRTPLRNPSPRTAGSGTGRAHLPGLSRLKGPSGRHQQFPTEYFLTIPPELLDRLDNVLGGVADPAAWKLEHERSTPCGDHCSWVGWFNGQHVDYNLLRPQASLTKLVQAVTGTRGNGTDQPFWPGMNEQQVQLAFETMDRRTEARDVVARGYCGWLLTQPTFLYEHDGLLARWSAEIRTYGLPMMGQRPAAAKQIEAEAPDENASMYGQAISVFCARWQLAALAAPYLPVPLRPSFPVTSTEFVTHLMAAGGALVYLPLSYPVPSRDQLRELLDDVLHASAPPPHLAGWSKIIAPKHATKGTQMKRYARVFELQHYLRLLHERHGAALRGKKTKLRGVFANFFGVTEESIEADQTLIRRGWKLAGNQAQR